MAREFIGSVLGDSGGFHRRPFYRVRLTTSACTELDALLARVDGEQRHTATLTATYDQPARVKVTKVDGPDYERSAAPQYLRGDVVRVQGRPGASCNLDVSARFGIPLFRAQLKLACERAEQFVDLRVPSHNRDVIEFIPDVDLNSSDDDTLVSGSIAAVTATLPPEDFSDWEK
jgi:hypothetical protein